MISFGSKFLGSNPTALGNEKACLCRERHLVEMSQQRGEEMRNYMQEKKKSQDKTLKDSNQCPNRSFSWMLLVLQVLNFYVRMSVRQLAWTCSKSSSVYLRTPNFQQY